MGGYENQKKHKSKGGSVGSREAQYYGRLQEPGELQDQEEPIGQQDHGGLGKPGGISDQREQWDQGNKKFTGDHVNQEEYQTKGNHENQGNHKIKGNQQGLENHKIMDDYENKVNHNITGNQ